MEDVMILYIDETECEDYFIVAGFLVHSKQQTDMAFKHFKNSLKSMKISLSEKQKVYTEFKSTLLDKHYQKIKKKMLFEIFKLNGTILFSKYTKNHIPFKQHVKEENYILMLSKIVSSINGNIDIIFDNFNNYKFESRIIDALSPYKNVISINPQDSRNNVGLQFIDNICSVIRLHHTQRDINNFFDIIRDQITEITEIQ